MSLMQLMWLASFAGFLVITQSQTICISGNALIKSYISCRFPTSHHHNDHKQNLKIEFLLSLLLRLITINLLLLDCDNLLSMTVRLCLHQRRFFQICDEYGTFWYGICFAVYAQIRYFSLVLRRSCQFISICRCQFMSIFLCILRMQLYFSRKDRTMTDLTPTPPMKQYDGISQLTLRCSTYWI